MSSAISALMGVSHRYFVSDVYKTDEMLSDELMIITFWDVNYLLSYVLTDQKLK